jgi:hypothetical protein
VGREGGVGGAPELGEADKVAVVSTILARTTSTLASAGMEGAGTGGGGVTGGVVRLCSDEGLLSKGTGGAGEGEGMTRLKSKSVPATGRGDATGGRRVRDWCTTDGGRSTKIMRGLVPRA